MRWIFENLGFFVFVFIAISMIRAIRKAMQLTKENGPAPDETEDQKNLRRIQEGIRRKIAERRAGTAADQPPPLLARGAEREPGPTRVPPAVPPLDAFGGPAPRTLADMARPAPSRELAPTGPALTEAAAVARQEELAEQMRLLEEARGLARRRAAEIAAARKAESDSEAGVLATARGTLLADLREPQSLRRALVLREVLGPPVALR